MTHKLVADTVNVESLRHQISEFRLASLNAALSPEGNEQLSSRDLVD